MVGFAYATGYGALGFELAYLVATVGLLLFFARRVWRMSRERGWVSPGEMLADLYGSRLMAAAAGLLYLVALIPYASVQVKGIGEAVAGLAGGGEEAYLAGVAVALAVMVVWSMVAGLWSVAVTDALQGLWMLGAATALLAWLIAKLHAAGLGFAEVAAILEVKGLTGLTGFWKFNVFLAFTLPWIFFATTNPQVVQRLYVPRDEASLARMVKWFSVFGLYYTVLVTLVGLLARAGAETGILPWVDPKNKDSVTPTLLSIAHPLLSAVVFTSIVAAGVSTADSILLTLAGSAARDLAGGLPPEKRRLVGVAAALLFAGAMGALAAARVSYIVMLAVLSSLALLPLAPVTMAAWLAPRRLPSWSGLLGLLGGVAEVAVAAAWWGKGALLAAPLGVPIAVWVLLASSIPVVAGALAGGPEAEA